MLSNPGLQYDGKALGLRKQSFLQKGIELVEVPFENGSSEL